VILMFERFTDRARRVVVLAQEEARMLDHNYIGTEHILLGLIHEGDGVACRALESLGISLEAVRQRVMVIIGRGQIPSHGHIPFTARAKRVLEFSLREATQFGHHYIGTEHILLGIIREGEGVGAQVLVQLGADLPRVRQQVVMLISGETSGMAVGSERAISVSMSPLETGVVDPELERVLSSPACPGCHRSLEGRIVSREIAIEGSSRTLFVVYCMNCGITIDSRIEEPRA
jgi:ATP-dependent Clp protease ATP-binding subunit ClpA